MKAHGIFFVGLCLLFSTAIYILSENLPTVLSKMRPLTRSSMSGSLDHPDEELPEPVQHVETVYYQIYGETDLEVGNTMDTISPVRILGRQHRASTHWPINWQLWPEESANGCVVSKVQAHVWIKYTYPQWKNFRAAQPELQDKWTTFMNALIRHEEGHKDIAVDAAREVQRAILEMDPRPTCSELRDDANELGTELLWKYDGVQKEFDEDESRHYYERGLAFP